MAKILGKTRRMRRRRIIVDSGDVSPLAARPIVSSHGLTVGQRVHGRICAGDTPIGEEILVVGPIRILRPHDRSGPTAIVYNEITNTCVAMKLPWMTLSPDARLKKRIDSALRAAIKVKKKEKKTDPSERDVSNVE